MAEGKKRRRQETEEQSSRCSNNKGTKGKSAAHKKRKSKADDLNSLIANLAKQASESGRTAKPTSKEERIQKRAAKKQRREQRHQQKNNFNESSEDRKPAAVHPKSSSKQSHSNGDQFSHYTTTSSSQKRIRKLATACREALPKKKKSYAKPFEEKPKKRRKTKPLDDQTVQPRPRDYGGLGMARETLYLQFQDPSFTARLEEEFQEHVDGFFGKQRTKAMKKQLDGNMLWRQLQKNKKDDNQKFQHMTSDQRVEAMLKGGML